MSDSNLSIVYDDVQLVLSTLGSKTVFTAGSKIDASRLNGFRVLKTEYWINYEGKTAGQGPIMVGLSANHDATEIEECIEADPQSSARGEDALNRAMRPVWPLYMIPTKPTDSLEAADDNGNFTPKWSSPESFGFFWWAYNMSGGALTDGTIVTIFAKHYGVWLRD